VYIKCLNADLIELETSQRESMDRMRRMPNDELIKTIGRLKDEILSLRMNEIFMKRVADQVKAIRGAMSLCNFECFYSNYKASNRSGFE